MDHSQFVLSLENTGVVVRGGFSRIFRDEVIQKWLEENEWVENSAMRCKHCQHMEKVSGRFSEELCRQKVADGGSCYRQTLRNIFIPFLRSTLAGEYPSVDDLQKVVHLKGEIWDGMEDMKIISIILHELGGTWMRMQNEAFKRASNPASL